MRRLTVKRGLAAVEVALVLPVLLIVVLGGIEYGWVLLKAQEINNITRHAARLAVTPDSTSGTVQADVTAQMSSSGMGSSGYAVTISPSDVTAAAVGDPVTVTLTVPYENISLMQGVSLIPLGTDAQLHASVTMAREGP